MAKKEKELEEKPRETTVEFLASLAAVLVTGLFIITFVLQAFEIPSSSMENTLLIGDHVFVNRIQFAPATHWAGPLMPYRDIRRQDIVVFLSPAEPGLYVVKRVIGVPGDRIHLRNGVVFRNGEKLDEPYVIHNSDEGPNDYRDNFPAVPPADYNRLFEDWQQKLSAIHSRRRSGSPAQQLFCNGRQSRRELRQPILGIHSERKCDRKADVRLLVIRNAAEPVSAYSHERADWISDTRGHPLL